MALAEPTTPGPSWESAGALEAFLAHLPDARHVGKEWQARCPAHADTHPSLNVTAAADGRVLVVCRSHGCTAAEICAALGLDLGALFPRPHGHAPPRRPHIIATYDYADADGQRLFQVVRYAPKAFKQRRPDPHAPDGWAWNLRGVRRVLYRLPELRAADPAAPVFLAEGEKDVENLRALGLVATTNAGGADQWRPADADALAGRPVVVLVDQDAAGEQRAQQVAPDLYGRAAWVRVLRLPDLGPKEDVSDWLGRGGTAAQLLELVAAAPCYAPPDLIAENAALRAQVAELVRDRNLTRQILRNAHLTAQQKIVALSLRTELAEPTRPPPSLELGPKARALVADGFQRAPQWAIAARGGCSESTVADQTHALSTALGVDQLEVRTASVRTLVQDPETHAWRPQTIRNTFVRAAPTFADAVAVYVPATPAERPKRQGGAQTPLPRCPRCGGPLAHHCDVCDLDWSDADLTVPAPPNPRDGGAHEPAPPALITPLMGATLPVAGLLRTSGDAAPGASSTLPVAVYPPSTPLSGLSVPPAPLTLQQERPAAPEGPPVARDWWRPPRQCPGCGVYLAATTRGPTCGHPYCAEEGTA